MIKLNVEKERIYELKVNGDIADITSELLTIIHTIYVNMSKESKVMLKKAMTESLPTCFMSETEREVFLEEMIKEDIKEAIGNDSDLDELLDLLRGLKKALEALGEDEEEEEDETVCIEA